MEIGNVLLALPETVANVKDMSKMQREMHEDLGKVKHEVQTNGGGSMKDAVRRLQGSIEVQDKTLRDIQSTLREHTDKLRESADLAKKAAELAKQAAEAARVAAEK